MIHGTPIGQILSATFTVLAMVSAAFFVVVYSALARWWRTSIGKALVTLDIGIFFLLIPELLHHALGIEEDAGVLAWYSTASLAVITIAICWRIVILIRDQVSSEGNVNDKDHVG